MREILFRGKRVDNGEWVYGYYIKATYHWHKKGIHEDWIVCGASQNGGWFTIQNRYAVISKTVGQYTGMTDRNGKKIFEGDIVRISYCFGWDDEQEKDAPEEEYISKVYSIDGCPFCVDLLHCDGDMSPIAWLDWSYDDAEIEVIGNIHDNPELLEANNG